MNSLSFENLENKYTALIKKSIKSRIKGKIKSTVKNVLRIIGGGQKVNDTSYGLLFAFDYQVKTNERDSSII